MNTRTPATHAQQGAEQLELLPIRDLPLQFRLDKHTRQRGLAHIAVIRQQLAASAAARPHAA